MKPDDNLTPEEAALDTEMRALVGTDDVDVPIPTHDAWRELGSHVRAKAAAPEEKAESPFNPLVAVACFAVALLAIAIAKPPKNTVVETLPPEPSPELIAESATAFDAAQELAEIDALMQQIELDELAIGLRDSGVVDDVEAAFDLLDEYGILDEDLNAL